MKLWREDFLPPCPDGLSDGLFGQIGKGIDGLLP